MTSRSFAHVTGSLFTTLALVCCSVAASAQALPDGWIAADVGSPVSAGSTTFDPTTFEFVMTAAGRDIWGQADEFHFLHKPASGDFSVETGNISGILPLNVPDAWTKAGVMIRQSLAPDSPYVYLCNTGANGLRIQYRRTPGGRSVDFDFKYGTDLGGNQYFLRIERRGDTFRFLASGNQGGFIVNRGDFLIGSLELPMADAVVAGTAVTSHNALRPVTARVDQFRTDLFPLTTPTFAPSLALNAGSSSGHLQFGPDAFFFGSSRVYSAPSSTPIADTELDPVYRSERWGRNFSYRIPLTSGSYYVELLLAEVYFNAPGARVFDILVQNQLIADDLDIYAEAGALRAYQVATQDVTVGANGILEIRFDASVNNAKVSGILVNKAPVDASPGAPTPVYFDLEPKLIFPLEDLSDVDGPRPLFIKDAVTFPDRYGDTGTLQIVGDAIVYTPSPNTAFLAPSIFSESFEVVVSDGLNDISIFYYPYFCDDAVRCG